MPGLTENIARFIFQTTYENIPATAIAQSKKSITDTFAVILAGANSEVTPHLTSYVQISSGMGSIPILGTRLTASPEVAAMVNGTFGHALDYDDVLAIMPGHPSAIIVAAILSHMDKRKISGRQLLEAYIVGIELAGKIGPAITIGHYNRGFHGTGTLGIFAAVGALAKLRNLDIPTTRMALGIACSMASGVRRNFGTMTKPLHTGWAARSALTAVDLATCGFTAAQDALEARSGFFDAYGVEASDPEAACDVLGKPWTVLDPGIALKLFPCYAGSHRAMDGVLQLANTLKFTADKLAHLECRMPPGGMRVLIYPAPTTGLEGKFSLQYSLAAGILDQKYALWTFTDEAVRRPEIQDVMRKVTVGEDARCGGNDPLMETKVGGSRGFVEVEVSLKDGRRETLRVDTAPGHGSRQLSWDDLNRKFTDCANYAEVDQERAQRAWKMLMVLEQCTDISAITGLLVKS